MRMSQTDIICKPTRDTFVRFGIVIAALLGFALYFFYDAATGYRRQNEAICSYRAFAALGESATRLSAAQWESALSGRGLIFAREEQGETLFIDGNGGHYPLPSPCEAVRTLPPEASDHAAMSKSWSDCWAAYSARMHYPLKPGDHPHDEASIREQWYAGGIVGVLGIILLFFALRTRRRELSLRGDTVTAAGRSFLLSDIECIDLRQWGKGFKGVAYFRVGGKRIRVDGMTYGGFSKEQGEPAETFMKAVLARYKGDIVEYEATVDKDQ